jgi:hypothetical protein
VEAEGHEELVDDATGPGVDEHGAHVDAEEGAVN